MLMSAIFSAGIMLLGYTHSGNTDALLYATFGTILFGLDLIFCTIVTSPHSAAAASAFIFLNTTGTALMLINGASVVKLLVITSTATVITVIFLKVMPFISKRCGRSSKSVRITLIIMTAGTVILYLLLFFFPKINGARVWFKLGPVTFQVSELTKLLFLLELSIIICSQYLSSRKQLIASALLLMLHAGFLILHNELGTLFLLVIVWSLSAFVFLPIKTGIFVLFGVAVGFMLCMLIVNSLYVSFQGTEQDNIVVTVVNKIHNRLCPSDTYQIDIALQAIVNGGALGCPSDYRLDIPVAESDFAFALLSQSLGSVTAILSVIAACVPVLSLYRFACVGKLNRNYILAFIAGLTFAAQSATVFFTNTGFFPTVGVGLPFISEGGSNCIINFILAAVIARTMSPQEQKPRIKRIKKKELRKNVKAPHKNQNNLCFADWCDDVWSNHYGGQGGTSQRNKGELSAGQCDQGAPE